MKDRAAAGRYARALEAALDGNADVERAAEDLASVTAVFSADPTSAAALSTPALGMDQRKALLETLVRSLRVTDKTARFLGILLQQERLSLVPEIATAMAAIRDRRLGIVEAEVTTAVPMSGDLTAQTKHMLEHATGRTVRLALKIDPALLGGIVARVGSTVYDGSLRTRLEAMRSQLARG